MKLTELKKILLCMNHQNPQYLIKYISNLDTRCLVSYFT